MLTKYGKVRILKTQFVWHNTVSGWLFPVTTVKLILVPCSENAVVDKKKKKKK